MKKLYMAKPLLNGLPKGFQNKQTNKYFRRVLQIFFLWIVLLLPFWLMAQTITGPVINCPTDITINNDKGECGAENVDLGVPIVTDNRLIFGNALDFDGTNDQVVISNSSSLNIPTNTVTLEAWVYLDELPSELTTYHGSIYDSFEDSYILYLDKLNKEIRFKTTDANGTAERPGISESDLVTGQWLHVAGVYDGNAGTASIYLNGALKDAHANAGLVDNVKPGQNPFIGGQSTTDFFDGKIDEIRVWNYAKTPSQIIAYMNTQLIGNEPGLVSYYDFNQGKANGNNTSPPESILLDRTLNGNDGSLQSFALTGSTSNWVGESGPIVTNNAPVTFAIGDNTVTWTATDVGGNSASCTQIVTVVDNEAPVIAGCPTNINQVNDVGVCEAVVTWIEPMATDNCTLSDDLVWTKSHVSGDTFAEGTTTVTYTATDVAGNTSVTCTFDVTVTNVLPSNTLGIIGDIDPMQAGVGFDLSADFNDDNLTSATWYFSSDGNFTNGDTAEYTQAGTIAGAVVSGAFNFDATQTGVYTVKVIVTDACGETAEVTLSTYVVVYDPSGGFVTGGGWFYSNAGNMPYSPTAEGKANFGFVAKYKNGKNNVLTLDGNTNFQFKEGDFHFKSNVYDEMSLVISGGKKATYRGVGTVNRSGSHKFLVSVIDGDATGGDGDDEFRIKVWADGSSSDVVYDNNLGNAENAEASTTLGGGSIVIHKPLNSSNSSAMKKAEVITELELVTWPNPSNDYFNIKLKSANTLDQFNIHVYDLNGRLVSFKTGEANRDYKIGESLQSGLYFINVVQGSESKQVKLIKH